MISFSFKSADKTGKSEVDLIEENKVWALVKRPSDKSFKQGKSSKLNEMLTQPDIVKFKKDQVCKLHKALYGLKQAPRAWNKSLVQFLSDFGPKHTNTQLKLEVFVNQELIVAIYVDDFVIASKDLLKQ